MKAKWCFDCVEKEAGQSPYNLSTAVFNEIRDRHAFEGEACPVCGSTHILPVLGMQSSYIKGYGFADKTGVRRDMDMHRMVTGNDPYAEHRKEGESRDVVLKLQQARGHDSHPKTIKL